MRARSGRADCALVTRAVYDAHPPDPARARGDVPRHGLSLLASSQKNWAWQIVAGRVRPHEKQITRTARAPVARLGTSAARRTRLAADLCFRSARNARLAPACPDGRFDRMMTLFLRWRTSRTTAPRCWQRQTWTGTGCSRWHTPRPPQRKPPGRKGFSSRKGLLMLDTNVPL